ncbi:thioredoxin domain-containing protein [Natrialbaceae archaeon AArc-T1-2]|uniref:thioredoxin domain-containing protein n=1 Tax=Natrialbaceae archaeon AArc-T1-2 TaxID=3053904 RepID=UPI00255B3B2D|nr:thioredoxin domain-containing protein [Natrialbaceae archaeon AArc-T1-2]WIV66215.1 thioredoxin domain-containing protein [Natrialbaceae archaeon AArc-T1-2]
MNVSRRTLLQAAGAGAVVGVAGCLGDDRPEAAGEPVDSLPAPVAGDPDADVTVEVYADFACPGCRWFELEVAPELTAEYVDPELVRYEHRDFPIPVDDTWSWAVANAARSVQDREGDDAFWSFVPTVFQSQDDYSYDVLASIADEFGYDGERTSADAEAGTYDAVLEDDRGRGETAGVGGTPAIVVDGGIVDIPEQPTVDDVVTEISGAIDDALE